MEARLLVTVDLCWSAYPVTMHQHCCIIDSLSDYNFHAIKIYTPVSSTNMDSKVMSWPALMVRLMSRFIKGGGILDVLYHVCTVCRVGRHFAPDKLAPGHAWETNKCGGYSQGHH